MKLAMIMLHIGERPHKLQYVCPICSEDNCVIMPEELAALSCRKCWALLDGTKADIQIIHARQHSHGSATSFD